MLRFAPSPTGYLHVGNARIALLNFFYSKKINRDFIIRFDNTDQDRSDKKFINSIFDDLSWLNIEFKSTFNQFDRLNIYKDIAESLKKEEKIYPCYETSEELKLKRKLQLKTGNPPIYDRSSLNLSEKEKNFYKKEGRKPHWRFKLENIKISWNDLVHGEISFDKLSISDPVVIRSDNTPLFTLTSVIDDIEFEISDILRGDDHITNTAAQIQIFEALNARIPNFGHFPLIKNKSGESLSKRKSSFSLNQLKENKIQPIVLTNLLLKMGTSLQYDKIQDIDELIYEFDINNFSKSSITFHEEDLSKINSKFISSLDFNTLKKQLGKNVEKNVWEVIKFNISKVEDIDNWLRIFDRDFSVSSKLKNKKLYDCAVDCLPKEVTKDTWKKWCEEISINTNLKGKSLFLPLRQKLTGIDKGPEMNLILPLLGRDEIIRRLKI